MAPARNWTQLPPEVLRERADRALAQRAELLPTLGETDAFRLIQGNREGLSGMMVDALGPVWLIQTQTDASAAQCANLTTMLADLGAGRPFAAPRSLYWKRLAHEDKAPPELIQGVPSPGPLVVRERGIAYELDLAAGYSQGLFLDQRENRRRVRELAAGRRVLNTFAYTCAFSVVAALGGAAEVLSLDLSRPSLDWGRRNFALNGLDPALPAHDFLAGDVFHWLERFVKKERRFDLVILDPPTFSRTKEGRVFRVERDYPDLVENAARLLPDNGGKLLCCTNQASLASARFAELIHEGLQRAGRHDLARTLTPRPLPDDFAGDDAMKNVWVGLRIGEVD